MNRLDRDIKSINFMLLLLRKCLNQGTAPPTIAESVSCCDFFGFFLVIDAAVVANSMADE